MYKTGLIIAALAGVSAISMPAAAQGKNGDKVANQYICTFHAAAVPPGLVRIAAEGAARPQGGRVLMSYKHALRGFAIYNSEAGIKKMVAANPGIKSCEPDRVVQLAPPPGKGPKNDGGGGGGATGQETDWGVLRVYSEMGNGNFAPANGNWSAKAWVIDSGVAEHEDLNYDLNDPLNISFITKGRGASSPDDQNGHGTHVAGTIAAINNKVGVVGVAPNARIQAVRVLDARGSGSYIGVLAGVDHVACHAADGDVANMSLGGPVDDGPGSLNEAVRNASRITLAAGATDSNGLACASGTKDIYFALAAGNESKDASQTSPASAATAAFPNIFVVSAFDSSDKFAYFSNFGSLVDYGEPGVNIKSTYPGGYAIMSGTSMAAPHLAGILVALSGGVYTDGSTADESTYGDGNDDTIGLVK